MIKLQKKFILLLMVQILLLMTCGGAGPEVSDEARGFKDEALANIESAKKDLSRVDDLTDEAKVGAVLAQLYFKATKSGHGPLCGFLFVNGSGVVIAGLYLDPKVPDGFVSIASGHNYCNYRAIKQALGKGKNAQCLLYFYGGKFYVVCSPLKRDGAIVGLICLAFSTEVVRGRIGVSEEDFLALDFNS